MESRRKSTKRPAHASRTEGRATSIALVRTPSFLSSERESLGAMARRIANRSFGALRARASLPTWALMPNWRRRACHIAPIIASLALTYVVIELFGNRYQPRTVTNAEILPLSGVIPGATASVVYTAKDERQCGGYVRRWIIDSSRVVYDLQNNDIFYHGINPADASLPFKFVREFPVPLNIAPGPASYHTQSVRWCNIFQEYFWPMISSRSIEFTAIPGAEHVATSR